MSPPTEDAPVSGACVLASGLVTPLGYNGPATLAALRAGISAVRALPWRDPDTGDPLRGARVSLPHWWFGVGMLADMAAAAIGQCLQAAEGVAARDIPILLGVSAAARPGRPAGLDETLLAEVHARLGLPQHPRSALLPLDQAGCAQGMLRAAGLLAAGARRVVLAGVDSYLDAATLDACIERRRLMTAANSNGFFPGEAACAVLLGPAADAGTAHLRILGTGMAREPAPIDSTEPFQARGLTQACRQALEQAGVTMREIGWRLTDLSGEHYKFKEASFVAGRLDTAPRPARQELWHPIEYLGDIGAAILPCLFAQALHAGRHGYAPPGLALCHVGSDAGERAAFVVRYDGPVLEEEL